MRYLLFFSLTILATNSLLANKINLQGKNINSEFFIADTVPGDLPINVVSANLKNDSPLLFLISGDGGWNNFSSTFAQLLSQKGFTVVGLDARKYFWSEKTPEQTTTDISKAIESYLRQFDKNNFVLAGYSFGAGVAPFVATRLSNDLKSKLKTVVSLSPDLSADFEIHVSDMLGFKKDKEKYDVLAEEKKIKAYNPICFFGDKEDDDVTNAFKQAGFKTIILPGNHHYSDNYTLIVSKFVEALNTK